MKKSQYIFAIMAAVYFIIAVLSLKGWIMVGENILLGLSMAALLSAISDVFSHIVCIRINQNEFGYIVQITSDFLGEKISNNMVSPSIDSRNVKLNVENMIKGYKKAVHPNEYWQGKLNVWINRASQICFILAIAVFILSSFPLILIQRSYSVLLTLFAFAAMCLNLYLEEIIEDISQKRGHFFGDTQLIIQMAYPDFMGFLNFRLYHYENYISVADRQENKSDTLT